MENAAAQGRETGRKTWRLRNTASQLEERKRRRTWEDEGGGRKRTEDDDDDDDVDDDDDDDDDDDHLEGDHRDDEDVNKVSAGSLKKRDETRLRPDYFD